MERTFCILAPMLLLAAATLSAQDLHGSFESWEERDARQQPVGWTTSPFGSSRSHEAQSGASAVKVWNWYSYASGVAVLGPAKSAGLFDIGSTGVPLSVIPTALTGWYRYVPGENRGRGADDPHDSAVVVVMLKRWSEARDRIDTLSYAELHLPPVDSYTRFTVTIPTPTSAPDSLVVGFVSSIDGYCGPDSSNCCYLTIDDVALVTPSGTRVDVRSLLSPAHVVPNPVTGTATITFDAPVGTEHDVLITNSAGEIVASGSCVAPNLSFAPGELPAGAYRFAIIRRVGFGDAFATPDVHTGSFVIP